MSDLQKLFEHTLKDIYFAEKQIVKTLPKLAKKAQSGELKEAFETHREQTEGHIERLEQVFKMIGKSARSTECKAIEGILAEGDEVVEMPDELVVRLVVIPLHGRVLDRPVHPLDLPIGPGMIGLGQSMFDPVFPTDAVERMAAELGGWA